MIFDALSAKEQTAVLNTDKLARTALIKARSAIAAMRIALLDAAATSNPILQQLDNTEVIPTECCLNGAADVPATALLSLLATYQSLLTVWDTDNARLLHANLVGAVNIDGRE
jgi:hypothetical protein